MSFWSSFDPALVMAYVVMTMTFNLTPGPAVLKVVSDAVGHGLRPAHASIAGIFTANMMYAALAVAGMGALILAFPSMFEIVKWLGVGYLCWLAVKALRIGVTRPVSSSVPRLPRSSKSLFWSSFAIQGANPKSVLTFCVTLPIFAGLGEGIELRMMALALLNNLLEYPVLLIYSWLGARAARIAANSRFNRISSFASASALGVAATMIAKTSLPTR